MRSKLCLFLIILSSSVVEAASYREKYASVLNHYQQIADHEKYDAALYLIDYMEGHRSPSGNGIKHYLQAIKEFKPRTDIGKLSKAWKDIHIEEETHMVSDSSLVNCDLLIKNIDEAFYSWKASPWKEHVSFKLFCEYILPYKVSDEYICPDWRVQLREAYQSKIEGVRDIKSAFSIIRREVLNNVRSSNTFTPYNLDPLSYEHIQRANCNQRCILLASVLRALAIPAAIDAVPFGADYSTMGHSWVALVLGEGATYTIYEDENTPKQNNRIDASVFLTDNASFDTSCFPFQIKNEKK